MEFPVRVNSVFFCIVTSLGFLTAGCNSQDTTTPVCTPKATSGSSSGLPFGMISHIPSIVTQYSDLGTLSDDQILPVTITLKFNNEDELNSRISALYDPENPSYHKFLKPAEFKARYAPSDAQRSRVIAYLNSHGIQTLSENENGYVIRAMARAQALNEAFQTEIHHFQASGGSRVYAPSMEPVLPEELGIQGVHGLHNVTRFHSYAHASPRAISPRMGSGPNGGLSPSDIKSAYNIPSNLTGAGQTLALFELDGYSATDVANYQTAFGLPHVPLTNVLVDGATGKPGSGAAEVTLDIELMAAIAPGASRILVYEAPNNDQDILDLYTKIANDNLAAQVSTSWGAPEATSSSIFLAAESQIFKQMAIQGQSIYAAAGDAGADDNGSSLSVDDPGSQPFVVSVGGTEISTNRGSYGNETTWNGGSVSNGAGGGGISTVWTQPSWQNGLANSKNQGSTAMRNVPDVSLNADPRAGYAIYVQGGWSIFGGTSCAAPIWAAFTALVNQQRAANGLSSLGFPNPYFYAIGRSSSYSSEFHDIQDGSNNLYYKATPGYDDATGWGTMNGQSLLNELSTDPTVGSAGLSC